MTGVNTNVRTRDYYDNYGKPKYTANNKLNV